MSLYTKNGIPLDVSGDLVYAPSGRAVGRINGQKVFGTNGRYVGTIVGDRLVYRSMDNTAMGSAFLPSLRGAFSRARVAPAGITGEEPDIPE